MIFLKSPNVDELKDFAPIKVNVVDDGVVLASLVNDESNWVRGLVVENPNAPQLVKELGVLIK